MNPIILTGIDLSFEHGREYAEGMEYVKPKNYNQDNSWNGIFESTDIQGQSVKTCWRWQIESDWLSSYAKKHKEVVFINATSRGLGIEGMQNLSLQELRKQQLSRSYDMEGKVHFLVQQLPKYTMDKKQGIELLNHLKESCLSCKEIIQELKEAIMLYYFRGSVKDKLLTVDSINSTLDKLIKNPPHSEAEKRNTLHLIQGLDKKLRNILTLVEPLIQKVLEIEKKYEDKEDISISVMIEKLKNSEAYRYILKESSYLSSFSCYREKRSCLMENTGVEDKSKRDFLNDINISRFDIRLFNEFICLLSVHIFKIEEALKKHSV